MAEATTRHGLPLLQAGQAQKEVTHNEAVVLLDLLTHAAVAALLATPPANPEVGQSWIVANDATGDWTGHEKALACWTEGGWRYLTPRAGMVVWQQAAGGFVWFDGGAWRADGWPTAGLLVGGEQVVGPQEAAIPNPTGGATIDGEARVVIGQILSALRAHGLIATEA